MSIIIDSHHNLLQKWRGRWDVQAPVVENHVVGHRPWISACAFPDFVVDGSQSGLSSLGVSETADEVEVGS
jgi:hypothetical protein